MAPKLVFIGGALKAPPPATRDAFQMLPQVGLIDPEQTPCQKLGKLLFEVEHLFRYLSFALHVLQCVDQ